MEIDEFLQLARKRRSIRKFKPDPVPDEHIGKILEAARWAPSGANGQPWEFIVVKNPETRKKLGEIYARNAELTMVLEMSRAVEFRQPSFRTAAPTQKAEEVFRARFSVWADAPVIIAVVGDKRTMQASNLIGRFFEYNTFDHNLANATYAIQLAAAAAGLGSQWISILGPNAEEMKPVLGIPYILTLFTLNAIGYPAIRPVPYRRELGDMVHYEKYDASRLRSHNEIQEFIKYQRQQAAQGKTYDTGPTER